ncbi:hypothetical protein C8Q79DRAFT_136984 [Trametes meyenii]|nr:hypothetical protein C8Q79DRAFT_136984 [Trametes meyenii]
MLFIVGLALVSTIVIPSTFASPAPMSATPLIPTSFTISDLNFSTAARPDLNFSTAARPDLNFSTAARPDITLGRAGLNANAAQSFAATLFMCEGANCGGACTFTNLNGIQPNVCTLNNPFTSVIIQQTFTTGTFYEVVVGPEGCAEVLTIPAVNECFNLSGALFEGYALIE